MLGSVARARDPDADLEYKLREAAGWQSHPAPKLAITGPIVALLDAGADLDLDVLPVIKSCAANCRSPNWKFFLGAITQARDDRINAATIVNPPSQANGVYRNGSDRKSYSRDATFDAIDRRIDELAAEERMRANGSADVDGFADGEAFPSRTPHH